ncbi:hypothetical protein PBI_OKIROE_94 [Mycobacterium phage OkiRoe]|uniref:DNA binding protein n=1 Tax=Mycobacterium phage OkiRoe TaxID=1486473 RepID=UPI00045F736D|nr:DNA binding protein [Mycobacterium phage OkiRoe]AHZ95655.1 hypothetical protein PBI_OKIROE_94 [Mycobacterium phage OkiRoe]
MIRETQQVAWLRNYLTVHGETPSADVRAAGLEAGFSAQRISRAAAHLGVESRREQALPSRTFWKLPAKPVELPAGVRASLLKLASMGHHDLATVMGRTYSHTKPGDVGVIAGILTDFAAQLQDRPNPEV